MGDDDKYLSAQEAAALLNIKLATLYAYVSRGLIRSEETDTADRSRRYWAQDVYRLHDKRQLRRNPERVVAEALDWGEPLLESALTRIEDGKFYYRGQDAVGLATTHTFEQVASLLWDYEAGEDHGELWHGAGDSEMLVLAHKLREQNTELSSIELFQSSLPLLATMDWSAYDLRPSAGQQTGSRLLKGLVILTTGRESRSEDIGVALQKGWNLAENAIPLLNAALILCADHELNISAFTARCVASAQSNLYQVVLAGLAALQGVKHGGQSARVWAMFNEVTDIKHAHAQLASRLRRGDKLVGFGHPLYPRGDPRGIELMGLIDATFGDVEPPSLAFQKAKAIATAAYDLIGEHPNIDFALLTLVTSLGLPPTEAITLFALGRTAGWIAHAIEQYETGKLIRPRARYIGA